MTARTIPGESVDIKIWSDPSRLDSETMNQLKRLSALPWAREHVAVMPDVHLGKGAAIGTVLAMDGAIAPAAIGADIGCGMVAARTNLTLKDVPKRLNKLRTELESTIPMGSRFHSTAHPDTSATDLLTSRADALIAPLSDGLSMAARQLGTLGGGNHFMELCRGSDKHLWLLLHSGSRGAGKAIADFHVQRAKKMKHNVELDLGDLSTILSATQEMDELLSDLRWAQDYAALNRQILLNQFVDVLEGHKPKTEVEEVINCHHNFVSTERHFDQTLLITRKGAIRAQRGERGIIPGSMGTPSFIVSGLGNADSFESSSHGAGRKMSRTRARHKYGLQDLRKQMNGIEAAESKGMLDEIPAAYKDINKVLAEQSDLTTPVVELRQLVVCKGI